MKLTLLAIGKARGSQESALFESYCKRLPWKITLKELEERRSYADAGERMHREGALLLSALPKAAFVVALDSRGKTLGSQELATQFGQWQKAGHSHIAFLIGGADGLDESVLRASAFRLSLGTMTWPHLLVRAMLAEQLYRAWAILQGHPYHR